MESARRTNRMPHARRCRRAVELAERLAWAFGIVCLGMWGALYIEGVIGARYELALCGPPGRTRGVVRVALSGALVLLMVAVAFAQTSTTTETKKFQIIAVDGNQLVVKLPEGTRETDGAR